jgi:hypothetical protein
MRSRDHLGSTRLMFDKILSATPWVGLALFIVGIAYVAYHTP